MCWSGLGWNLVQIPLQPTSHMWIDANPTTSKQDLMCNTYANTYYVLLPGSQHIFVIEGITFSSYHLNGPLLRTSLYQKTIMTAVSQMRERPETKNAHCLQVTKHYTVKS